MIITIARKNETFSILGLCVFNSKHFHQWAFFSLVHWLKIPKAMEELNSCFFNPAILDSLTEDSLHEIIGSYNGFCAATQSLLTGNGDLSVGPDFVSHVQALCKHRLHSLVQDHFLRVLEVPHNLFHQQWSKVWKFIDSFGCRRLLNEMGHRDFGAILIPTLMLRVWTRMMTLMWVFLILTWILFCFFSFFRCGECLVREWLKQIDEDEIQSVLYNALEEVTLEKQYQEKCLLMLVHGLQSYKDQMSEDKHDFEGERNYLTSKYQWIVSSVLMASLPRHFPGLFAVCCFLIG